MRGNLLAVTALLWLLTLFPLPATADHPDVAQHAAPKPPDDEVGGQGVDRRGGRVDLQVLRDGRV